MTGEEIQAANEKIESTQSGKTAASPPLIPTSTSAALSAPLPPPPPTSTPSLPPPSASPGHSLSPHTSLPPPSLKVIRLPPGAVNAFDKVNYPALPYSWSSYAVAPAVNALDDVNYPAFPYSLPSSGKRKAVDSGNSNAKAKRPKPKPKPKGKAVVALSSAAAALELEWPEASVPKWLTGFYKAFRKGLEWDEKWADLVRLYLKFEDRLGNEEDGFALPSKDRPGKEHFGEWFKNRRSPSKIMQVWTPEIGDVWRRQWWTYWQSIQPAERRSGEALTRPDKLDWGDLCGAGGKNGFLFVMISLYWWGDCSQREDYTSKHPDNLQDWVLAVEEVLYALDSIIAHGVKNSAEVKSKKKSPKKRKEIPEDSQD